jgi:hypothetical protein
MLCEYNKQVSDDVLHHGFDVMQTIVPTQYA